MDARYFMQDNSEHLREQFEAMRERQLLREGEVQQEKAPAVPVLANDGCLPVKALRIVGITLLSPSALKELPQLRGDCLDGAQLADFVYALTRLYVQNGYITTRVIPETASDGVMTLRVIEGRVDRIVSTHGGTDWLLPGVTGQALNMRILEQGLDQANRLQSVRMRAEILPGTSPGASTIRLIEQNGSPWQGSLSFDNRGYTATGRDVAGFSVSRDNLSGRYDFLNAALERSQGPARYSQRSTLFYSLPRGNWTLSLFNSQSEYLNTQPLVFQEVELTGRSAQYGLRLDRVIDRGQRHIASLQLQLAHKRVRNYFLDSMQHISSPTLTVLQLGAEHTALHRGGALSFEAVLARGMPWLGADRDWMRADSGLPRAQFLKGQLTASLRQNLPVAAIPLWLESRLYAQGSHERLPAIEQLELADSNMVRGFRHNSLSGAVGWAWHNTFSSSHFLGALQLRPRLALDAGRILWRGSARGYQTIIGAGAGLALGVGRLSLDIEYNRPLYRPSYFVDEPQQLLARLAWQL